MNIIVPFRPLASLRAEDQVTAFIDLARTRLNDVLIADTAYSAVSWDVTRAFTTKGDKCERWLHFVPKETRNLKARSSGNALKAPFIEFAKAYVRYRHSAAAVSYGQTFLRLHALRLVEAAFRSVERAPEIWNLDAHVLNRALDLVAGSGSHMPYKLGNQLEILLQFCAETNLLASSFRWRCQLAKPREIESRLGKEFADRRAKRLPSRAAFDGLAHVFRNPQTAADRLYSAITAICCGIPIRAHEVLQLSVDCEVEAEPFRRGEEGQAEGGAPENSRPAYGIRVWPGKGNVPHVKWVPDAFADVVREAVQRLRVECTAAREVAAWYERNPKSLWLPRHLEHLRSCEWILVPEVQAILGLPWVGSAQAWVDGNAIAKRRGDRLGANGQPLVEVRFSEVERKVLSLLPKDFPYLNGMRHLPYSNALAVVKLHGLNNYKTSSLCLIEPVGYHQFYGWLRGKIDYPSVFERYGLTEEDGSPIQITTHAFRHWLNTIAHMRGVGELDIAKWSGRHPDQNHFYDHETASEILEAIDRVVEDDEGGHGPVFEAARAAVSDRKQPIPLNEIKRTLLGSSHITEVGICVHDYSLLPCQNHGNCLGCAENVFVKGDPKHRAKIERQLTIALEQLVQAETAVSEAIFGADRWVQAHLRRMEQMRRILAVHDDPAVRDGDVVGLHTPSQDSEIQMALRDRPAPCEADNGKQPGSTHDGAQPGDSLADEVAEMFE
ncbi:hypothetical protein JMJ56_09235 [Belnapia sp. T18]|uniref:Integrase n=1 Tax=Belnapia arida TaxID=2804533 RepID=A0ABS1U391_9PROT|nr:hypothetical protein [Belnapia arida]MBL6078187.1 hypothetical protein [Belnapia arida]